MAYFCSMRYKFNPFLILIVIGIQANAQQKWDLRKCVDYALENNISIKQTDVQARLAKLAIPQCQL
jgi:outer membrane protein